MIDDDTLPTGQPIYRATTRLVDHNAPEGATHYWAKGQTYYRLDRETELTTSRIWFWSAHLNKWLESEHMPEYMLGLKLRRESP